ncbi:SUMF1/EgtB/PvdO family nonheme iron enzyme [Herbidospora sp. NEAU-GS84]|uniref:SUMF1/EgtB/PvdO family nonheme iron enzyme n=1 Tax=Herbidospora solisilvae TaxID=2696284 RepID=A0A7C9P1B8_9ACTN|nr:SUMF1/EgtB/PvdO family nonheme iron enzyme [Herbidospora solisilvae]
MHIAPTEAEGEYAAHGSPRRQWPGGAGFDPALVDCVGEEADDLNRRRTWWARQARHRPSTTPVGAFSPGGDSPLGVPEWVAGLTRCVSATRRSRSEHRRARRGTTLRTAGGGRARRPRCSRRTCPPAAP